MFLLPSKKDFSPILKQKHHKKMKKNQKILSRLRKNTNLKLQGRISSRWAQVFYIVQISYFSWRVFTHVNGSSQYSLNMQTRISRAIRALVKSVAVISMNTFFVFSVIFEWSPREGKEIWLSHTSPTPMMLKYWLQIFVLCGAYQSRLELWTELWDYNMYFINREYFNSHYGRHLEARMFWVV